MSQNLISVPETDEEEQGDRQQITRDAEEEPKRVSFSALTSSLHPPRHHRGSSSQSDASSSSTNRRLHRLGHLLKQNTSKCDSDLSPDSPPDSQHSRSSRPANPRSLSASVAARLGRFSSGHEADLPSASDAAPRVYRRYRVGDSVLVSNHQSRFANLVNRYGYPPGGGLTPEEQRGPYVYVLATVQKVHFEEDAEYYTVIRVDTGVEQRADDGKQRTVQVLVLFLVIARVLTLILLCQNGWNPCEQPEVKLQLGEQLRSMQTDTRTKGIVTRVWRLGTPRVARWSVLSFHRSCVCTLVAYSMCGLESACTEQGQNSLLYVRDVSFSTACRPIPAPCG